VDPTFPRLFSVEEANALLPRILQLLDEAADHRSAMRERVPHLGPVVEKAPANGGSRAASQYFHRVHGARRAIGRIQELGVLIKDLDAGIVDFPHERDGRVVFLCWNPREERVAYWHEVDEGYRGRQPL
jgi:hypothetical protein